MATVAAPIDIDRRSRRLFPIRRKKQLTCSLPHPLEFGQSSPCNSDSDSDSCFESSYNESILSAGSLDSCYSAAGTTLLRSSVSPPVVSVQLASGSSLTSQSSHEELTRLIKSSNEARIRSKERQKDERKRAVLRKWPSVTASWMTYALMPFSPRSTDDKIPPPSPPSPPPHLTPAESRAGAFDEALLDMSGDFQYFDEELVTFSEQTPAVNTTLEAMPTRARNRDHRINSGFLRRYAIDYAARCNRCLPSSELPREIRLMCRDPRIAEFDACYDLARVLALSKARLWDGVVLPPRDDCPPALQIDYSSYIHCGTPERMSQIVGPGPSLGAKNGRYIPWATHRASLKPAGVSKTSRPVRDTAIPTALESLPQYTIRDWANARWVPT